MFNEKNGFSSPEKKFKSKKKRRHSLSLDSLLFSGLLMMNPNTIHGANDYKQDEKKIEIGNEIDTLAVTNPKPADYDIDKIGKINLTNIIEKKSCDPVFARKLIAASIITEYSPLVQKLNSAIKNLIEYERAHPDLKNKSILSNRLENKEFNAIYSQFEFEKKNVQSLYQEIIKESEEANKMRLERESIPDTMKKYIEAGPELLETVESVRNEILDNIKSTDYLKLLQIEFNCTLELAKEHQKTRFNNIKNINYFFKYSQKLEAEVGYVAYFVSNTNEIVIPFDVNLNDEDKEGINLAQFKEIVAHEMWHAATNAELGISLEAKNLLGVISEQVQDYDTAQVEYYGNSSEQYARFKSLEKELADLQIWTKGEIFTREISDKMLNAYNNKEFVNSSTYDFIETIFKKENSTGYNNLLDYEQLFQVFSKIFNSIAVNSQKDGKVHYHSDWDYSNTEQKA